MSMNKGRKRDGRPGSPGKPQGSRKPTTGRSPKESRPPRAEKPFGEERSNHKERSARSETGGRSNFSDKPKREERPERPYKAAGDKPFRSEKTDRPRREGGDKPFGDDKKTYGKKPSEKREGGFKKDDRKGDFKPREGAKPFGDDKKSFGKKPFEKFEGGYKKDAKPGDSKSREGGKSSGYIHPEKPYKNFRKVKGRSAEELDSNDGNMRLNRMLSTAGIASRREADTLIKAGLVTVNGKVVTELGTKVNPTDDVRYNGTRLLAERKVYLVMNKPKGFITTVEDEKARKTVMELFAGKVSERIYPVGRLDRGTTGVLMFTNDGDLAKKLTHPSHGARKIYQVSLDKPLTAAHLRDIKAGVELEDGVVPVDDVAYVDDKAKTNVGLELHVGRNRIVRRLFEHLGYEVVKLDRSNFAGLTKKNLERGHWRHLTAQELNYLKMLK